MKKLLFIYNPKSGRQFIYEYLADIISLYTKKGYLTTVYPTQKKKDGLNKIIELANDYDKFVVSGGDGTLDEIVSGAVTANIDSVIGYIPSGSTNDFSNTLEIPDDIKKAMELAVSDKYISLDVGKFNNKHFIYVAAFGSIAEVSFETDQKLKNNIGRMAYILEGFKSLTNMKTYNLDITLDDENINGEFILGAITNTTSLAGFKGFLGYDVDLSDGLFEITLVKRPQNLQEFNKLVSLIATNQTDDDIFILRKAKNIKITSNEKIKWTLDGEYGGSLNKVNIEVLNRALKLNSNLKN